MESMQDDVTRSENRKDTQQGAANLHPRLSRLGSLRNWRSRLLLYCAVLAVVFAGVGVAQHWFVHGHVERSSIQELARWAAQVSAEIAYRDKWDLDGYRNAAITCPGWYVITRDGLIIDVETDIPWMFGRVEVIDSSTYGSPRTVLSSVGETWRLLAKRLGGGTVVVGILSPQNTKEADKKLVASIRKFGATAEKAASIRSREIDAEVDYAVLSSTGELKSAFGGVPLRTRLHDLTGIMGKRGMTTVSHGGTSYRLYSEPILDTKGQLVGTIIIPKDVTLEQQAIHQQDLFNVALVAFSLVVSLALGIVFLMREFLRRHAAMTIEEAMKVGESKTVEFKSTYHWDIIQGQQKDERRFDVLRSIAGFLNTDGGNLYIGVSEDPSGRPVIRGLEEDLRLTHGSKDKLQRSLRDLITARIGSEFAPFITDRIEAVQDNLCWIVTVDPSPQPVFVRWKAAGESKEQKRFFVREGPKTSDLDNERTWRYIRNKWG